MSQGMSVWWLMRVFIASSIAADSSSLADVLEASGFRTSTSDDIPAGVSWIEGITKALESCDAVVLVPRKTAVSKVARVAGMASLLSKPFIAVISPGMTENDLPFSLRDPAVQLSGSASADGEKIRDALQGVLTLAALRGSETGDRSPAGALPNPSAAPNLSAGEWAVRANSSIVDSCSTPFSAPYRAIAFPDGVIDGVGTLQFSADDLAHALFVTGRAPGDRAQYGTASLWEWLHRTSLIPAYVRRHYKGGRLVRSRLATELDRSELVGFSYALGQAVTAIFCREKLQVSHLLHVDRYGGHYNLAFGATRKRADLFGISPNGWVVAEAKGRSRSMETGLSAKLRAQKRSIAAIGGVRPWLALGCVASFPIDAVGMRIDAVDPIEEEVESIEIPASLDDYMLAYYAPFVVAIDAGDAAERDDLIVESRFGSFGVTVRMSTDVYIRVQQAAGGEIRGLSEDLQVFLQGLPADSSGLLADGIAIETDWAEAMAIADWLG
ncbi:toll/interleukin-1 receptor domain-containing protein [Actinoplanes sp. NBC_00393]|uniref:hypothetical protein n=1 Tax=Actinoplanes sp. NBC_00393 TaxID=2975953 RepID=UPI002E1F14CD